MFSSVKIRIATLVMLLSATLLLTYGIEFNGFAAKWQWQSHHLDGETSQDMTDYQISSSSDGVLVTARGSALSKESKRYYQGTSYVANILQIDLFANGSPPLLDALIPERAQKIQDVLNYRLNLPLEPYDYRKNNKSDLFPITHVIAEKNNKLYFSARFAGGVTAQGCDASGHCYIITDVMYKDNPIVYYSENGGRDWQWLKLWQLPKRERISGMEFIKFYSGSHYLLSWGGRVYQTQDQGKSWSQVADSWELASKYQVILNNRTSQNYEVSPNYERRQWLVNQQDQIITWLRVTDKEDSSLKRILFISINILNGQENQTLWDGGMTIMDIQQSPDREIYFVMIEDTRQNTRSLYSLNRLNNNLIYDPILETGTERLGKLYVGERTFILERNQRDREYITFSSNNSIKWQSMEKLSGENIILDARHNRLFRFPETYQIPDQKKSAGLNYQVVDLK